MWKTNCKDANPSELLWGIGSRPKYKHVINRVATTYVNQSKINPTYYLFYCISLIETLERK